MDNEHWTCYSKNINHLYFTFNEKDVFIILHCLGEPFDVTLSVFVRLGASMTKAFWTKQGTVAWHIAVRFAIFLQRAAHKLPIFSTSGTRAEKVDCERSLFSSSDLVRGVPRARALSDEAARGEKRGRLPVSRLQSRAWSFARLGRFARRTNKKERLLVVYRKSVCSKPRFVTALSDLLFNKLKHGRNFEHLFQTCALLLPVTFLTGSHVCKSDLTSSRLWLCQQEIW